MKPWTRRTLLTAGAVIASPFALLGAGKLACKLTGLPKDSASILRSLDGLYPESAVARALGQRYLQQTGLTPVACLRRLEENKLIAEAAVSGCRGAALSAIEETCRDDFRSGRIHVVDGWILAQTELDLAALSIVL
jgi:hypothetical protein